MTAAYKIHAKYGNIFGLNVYTKLEPLREDLVVDKKYINVIGNKTVYHYSEPPESWNIRGVTQKAVRIELNDGSYFKPHKDLFPFIDDPFIRLLCFANHSHPEECTFIIDGKITHFKSGQWMCFNPCLTHYSICFTDNTVHYAIDLDLRDNSTYGWLMDNIEHTQRTQGPDYK